MVCLDGICDGSNVNGFDGGVNSDSDNNLSDYLHASGKAAKDCGRDGTDGDNDRLLVMIVVVAPIEINSESQK